MFCTVQYHILYWKTWIDHRKILTSRIWCCTVLYDRLYDTSGTAKDFLVIVLLIKIWWYAFLDCWPCIIVCDSTTLYFHSKLWNHIVHYHKPVSHADSFLAKWRFPGECVIPNGSTLGGQPITDCRKGQLSHHAVLRKLDYPALSCGIDRHVLFR